MSAETLHEPVEARVLFEALQILSKALADIGADQGLIAREPEQRSDGLQSGRA